MKKLCCCLSIMLMPASSWAQSAPPATSLENQVNVVAPSRWRFGLGVVASDYGYVGQGIRLTPLPLVDFEGDRFYFRGVVGGMHLLRSDESGFAIDAIVMPGLGGIDAKDFSRSKLASRGIDRKDLQDRNRSINSGFRATWSGAAGQLELEATSDISGNSKGQDYSLKYGYAVTVGGFTITPSAELEFLSGKTADYYYGIHPREVRRGVVNYQAGGSLIPEIGVSLIRPIGEKWALIFGAKYGLLPDKLSNSPLVDGSHTTTLFVGFSRSL